MADPSLHTLTLEDLCTPRHQDALPVFLLVTANAGQDQAQHLRHLDRELNHLRKQFDLLDQAGRIEFKDLGNATGEALLRTLSNRRYAGRIALFHFAGHADGLQLLLQDAEGELAGGDVSALADLLKTHGVQLAFLNGCATEQQAQALIQQGLPHVVYTETAIEDEAATLFADGFYRALIAGHELRQAMQLAQQDVLFQRGSTNLRSLWWPGQDSPYAEPAVYPWRYLSRDPVAMIVQQQWRCLWEELKHPAGYRSGLVTFLKKGSRSFAFARMVIVPVYLDSIDAASPTIPLPREQWSLLQPDSPSNLPVILVAVVYLPNRPKPRLWWLLLSQAANYQETSQQLQLIGEQVFHAHSKTEIERLVRGYLPPEQLQALHLLPGRIAYLQHLDDLPGSVREQYRDMQQADMPHASLGGDVQISRHGWRQMHHRSRTRQQVLQSWLHLGAAAAILQQAPQARFLRPMNHWVEEDGTEIVLDLLALEARVAYPFREAAHVAVHLLRRRIISRTQNHEESSEQVELWFHNVVEQNGWSKQMPESG